MVHLSFRHAAIILISGARAFMPSKEKVVLAYSGGLDTTAIIPWLKENFDYEVICVCVDCGQAEELDGLEERAISCGASKCGNDLYVRSQRLDTQFETDLVVPLAGSAVADSGSAFFSRSGTGHHPREGPRRRRVCHHDF